MLEKITWKTLMPRSFRLAATASRIPSTTPIGTVSSTNCAVIHRPSRNSSPVSTSVYWLGPTQRWRVPVRFCSCRPSQMIRHRG